MTFLAGVPEFSENFPSFPCELDDLSYLISLGFSAIVAGSDIYWLICQQYLQDVFPLFSMLYRGVSGVL